MSAAKIIPTPIATPIEGIIGTLGAEYLKPIKITYKEIAILSILDKWQLFLIRKHCKVINPNIKLYNNQLIKIAIIPNKYTLIILPTIIDTIGTIK